MNGIHVLTARLVEGEYETREEILLKIEDRDLTGFLIT